MPEALPAVTVPSFLKAGAQLAQTFQGGLGADVLVGVEDDGVALALRDDHRHDLGLELAVLDGRAGLALAVVADLVLHLAGDAVLLGHVLGGDAHVDVVHGALQTVQDHLVLQDAVAHAVALAGVGDQVRGHAHVLHAAGHDDLGVAGLDGVGGLVDGLHARAAHDVEGEGRDLLGKAGHEHALRAGFWP